MKEGWEVRPLSKVCELYNGRAYKKKELLDDGQYRVLRVGNFFTNNHWYYSDLELPEEKYCENGDLLYAWSASFGPRIWEGEKVIYHYHIWKVVPEADLLDRDFLFYFFEWDKEKIKAEQGAGTTMIHVSKGSMEARLTPLPPLEEQKRIVAVLDEAFEGLAIARANAEANLKNSKELFTNSLSTAFGSETANWTRTTVGELVDSGVVEKPLDGNHGEIHPKKADFVESGVPFIMASDLAAGVVDQENCYFIGEEQASRLRKGFAKSGDILLSHKGTIGRVAKLTTKHDYVMLTPQITYYRVIDADTLIPDFLFFVFRSSLFQRVIEKMAGGGATRAYIGITRQLELPIWYPQKTVQRQLIGKFEEIEKQSVSLERNYAELLAQIDQLKQSLLQQAFAGKLT